jgi:hypothetical protein
MSKKRAARAAEFTRLAKLFAAAEVDLAVAGADVHSPDVDAIDSHLRICRAKALGLAIDLAQGEVEIEGERGEMPLFERAADGPPISKSPEADGAPPAGELTPAGSEIVAALTGALDAMAGLPGAEPARRVHYPVGTPLWSCNFCLQVRPRGVPTCSHCQGSAAAPFFVNGEGQFEHDKAAQAQQEMVSPTAVRMWPNSSDLPTGDGPGQSPSPEPADWLMRCNSCGWEIPASLNEGCRKGHTSGFSPVRRLEPGEAENWFDPDPRPEKKKRAKKAKAGPSAEAPAQCTELTPVESGRNAVSYRTYEVSLVDDGSGNPTFLGRIVAPSLAEAVELAPLEFKAEVVEGTPLVVTPATAVAGEPWPFGTELAECVACGKRWPRAEGVGCPVCVHGPITPMPGAMQSDAIAAQSGGPLDWRSTPILDLEGAGGVAKSAFFAAGFGTAGEAWGAICSGDAAGIASLTLAGARDVESAILRLREKAGDPDPHAAPMPVAAEERPAPPKPARKPSRKKARAATLLGEPEPAEAPPSAAAEADPAALADGCRVLYRDREGREWPGTYKWTLGRLASVALDDVPDRPAAAIRVDPSTLRQAEEVAQ